MSTVEARFAEVWSQVLSEEVAHERSRGIEPEQYYTTGRSSKAYPDKEGPRWWFDHGPDFVEQWVTWRDNCGLEIAVLGGEPAIELEVRAKRGDLEVFSIIDRVFTDGEDLYIVDLKTGSTTPAWPRQLALNNLGLAQNFGVTARFGGFWNPRKGGLAKGWSDLRMYDADWMWRQVEMARNIRDGGNFVAQPTFLCEASCGVREYCKAVGGALSLSVVQP